MIPEVPERATEAVAVEGASGIKPDHVTKSKSCHECHVLGSRQFCAKEKEAPLTNKDTTKLAFASL